MTALLVAIADQLSKLWVLRFFAARPDGSSYAEQTSFFNFVLTGNRGMSFGLFNNNAAMNTIVFTILATVIVIALIVWMRRAKTQLMRFALGLVIGGAIGNVIDRIYRGAVVDFLDFHLGDWHWFAFNVADAGICIGVVALLIDGLLAPKEVPK
jgi:signal peptidase II